MYQIFFEAPTGEKFCKNCKTIEQKNIYLHKLTEAGIECTVIGETKPQLCSCVFKADGTLYSYVRAEGDAEPGMLGSVEVTDGCGRTETKTVAILKVKETTIEECRALCNALNRPKLARIKRVWKV